VTRVLFVAVFGGNSTNNSQADRLEDLGCAVTRYNYRVQAEKKGPHKRDDEIIHLAGEHDLVLYSKGNGILSRVPKTISQRYRDRVVNTAWMMDYHHNLKPDLIELFDQCQHVFFARGDTMEKYAEKRKIFGADMHFLAEGFDEKTDKPYDLPKLYDATFIGSVGGVGCHYGRAEMCQEAGIKVIQGAYGADHAKVVSQSRINISFTEGNGISDRVYKILGAGGFLLAQEWGGPPAFSHVREGGAIDTFGSVEELKFKIDWWKDKTELRNLAASKGLEEVQDYSRDTWARYLLGLSLGIDVSRL